jgi:hypothetical protein
MSANEAASFLSSLTPPDSDYEIVEKELNQLTRKPGEKLFPIVNKLKALAETMYRDLEGPEKVLHIERVLINGLLSLTMGETKRELERALILKKRRQEKVHWDRVYEAVLAAEEEYGPPTEVLYYRTSSEQPILNFNVSHKVVTKPATIEQQVCTTIGTGGSKKTTPRLTVDTSFPPPMGRPLARHELKPVNTSGTFLQYRDETAKDASLSEADNSAESQIETESASILISDADMDTLVENLSKISAGESSKLELTGTELSVPTQSASTPMPKGYFTQSGRRVVVPEKLQVGLNNISIDILAAKVAEQMLAKGTDFKKSGKEKKSSERKSRKDKYEKKSSDKQDKAADNNSSKRSDSKASGTSKSRGTSATSGDSSRSRSASTRRERKKTWSDTDFKAKRGLDCSKDYDPRREKRCMKCLTEGTHHEFQCKKFLRRAPEVCPNCRQGFHWKQECDKPTKRADSKSRDGNNIPKTKGN